jgi:hypothetical protein
MKYHERELLISMIRCGKVFISHNKIDLEIRPQTIEQSFKACKVYDEAYYKAYSEEIMTEDDMNSWMLENDLWTAVDDKIEEGIKQDIEKLKVEIFNSRIDDQLVKKIRSYLRSAETQLSLHIHKKHLYHQNTCEGVASAEKLAWIIKNTTYRDNQIYDFEDISLQYIVDEWQNSFVSDTKSRELARNDPWKSLWIIKDNNISLFSNPPNTELTYNQKSLLVWSKMYDNIQESLDCPEKNVIDDDDMLDGWFIIQSKKREKERLERELDNEVQNHKIKNASEVYVVSNNDTKRKNVEMLNGPVGNMIKAQRNKTIQSRGSVSEQDLPDQQQNLKMMASNKLMGR